MTDSNGCSGTDSLMVVTIVGIDQGAQAGDEGFTLYPNPTVGDVFIRPSTGDAGSVKIRLIDVQGQILNEMSIEHMTQETRVELSNYASGIYFVEVYSGERKFTFKVIRD